jgi:hypothetical protein
MPKKSVKKYKSYGGTNMHIEHMTELQFGLSELQAILQTPFKNLLEYDGDIKKLHDKYNEDIQKQKIKLTARKKSRKSLHAVLAAKIIANKQGNKQQEAQAVGNIQKPELKRKNTEMSIASTVPADSQNDGFSDDEGDKMDDIQEEEETGGGKLKVYKKKRERTLEGGIGEYNYTINQVLSVWHLFDKYHDFKKYSLFTKDDEKKIIKKILKSNHDDMQTLYDNDCEAKNFHILLKHLRANSETPLSSLMLYYRIHSSASNTTNALVRYKNPRDETSAVEDLNIGDTPTYLRDLLSSKTNSEGTQGTQEMTMIYDTNLNLSIPSSGSSGTSDEHIWTNFKDAILEKIGTQKNPFAKIWDPHGQSDPDTPDVNPCKGTDDEKKQKEDIIDKVYNTANDDDNKQNYNAFRKLTQDHFEIKSACSGDEYIGIRICFKKIGFGKADTINETYKSVIKFIIEQKNGVKEFKFEDYKNHLSVIIKSNGFSKEIIGNTIKKMYTDLDESFFQDENKYKILTTTESYNVKLLALLLIAHIYVHASNKDDLKLVFFDFKKSGDWGQVLYCKELKPKGCFISMDRYSALYSIMHDVPTIFLSTMLYHDPEKHKRDYCEVGIYMTDRQIDMAYIRRLLCDYARSVLFTKFRDITDTGTTGQGQINILNAFVEKLLSEINKLIPQTNSKNILNTLLAKDHTSKNILQRIFNLYLDTIIRIFTVLLTQFSITSDFMDEFYVIKRIQLNGFLSQISDGMNVEGIRDTNIYNIFFNKVKEHFDNQINNLFNDQALLQIMRPEHKQKPRSSTSPMSTGSPRSSASPMSTGSPRSSASSNTPTHRHTTPIRPMTPTQGLVTPITQIQTGPRVSPALSDISQADTITTSPHQNVEITNDIILINLINNFKKILDDLFDIFYIIYYYFICDDENNINVFLHHYVKNVFLLFFDTSCTIRAKLNTYSKPSSSARPPSRTSGRHRRQTGEDTVDINPVQESLRNSCTTSISHLRSSAESAIITTPSGDAIVDLKTKYNKLLQIYEIFLSDFNTSVSRLHFELFDKIGFLYKKNQTQQASILHSFYNNLCIEIKTILDDKIDNFFITKSETTNNEFHIHVRKFIAENLESVRQEQEDISIDTISFNNINDFLLTELKQIHDKIKQDFENVKGPILTDLIDKEFLNKKAKTTNDVLNKIDEMYKIYKGNEVGGGLKRGRESDDDHEQNKRGKKHKAPPERKAQGQSVKTDTVFKKQYEKIKKIKAIWRTIEQYIMLFEKDKDRFKKITELFFFITDKYTPRTDNDKLPDTMKTSYKNLLKDWEDKQILDISNDIINNKLSFNKVFDTEKYEYMIAHIEGISKMIRQSIIIFSTESMQTD